MAKYEWNGGQTFVTPTPIVNSTSLIATYPQTYTVLQQHQPPAPGKYEVSFSKKSAISLGVFLVVCGAISQIGAAIALRFLAGFHQIALGLWAGNIVSLKRADIKILINFSLLCCACFFLDILSLFQHSWNHHSSSSNCIVVIVAVVVVVVV